MSYRSGAGALAHQPIGSDNDHHPDHMIRMVQTRKIAHLLADPTSAYSKIITTGRVSDGLTCVMQQGNDTAIADLGRGMGGQAAGPSPGFYARAAIASCVAIGIKMSAARAGLPFRNVDVAVETDFDDLAIFGLGASTAAPLDTQIRICIDTDVDHETVSNLVSRVLEMDPWFLALRDAQRVVTQVETT